MAVINVVPSNFFDKKFHLRQMVDVSLILCRRLLAKDQWTHRVFLAPGLGLTSSVLTGCSIILFGVCGVLKE
jgi:hypothetical protein